MHPSWITVIIQDQTCHQLEGRKECYTQKVWKYGVVSWVTFTGVPCGKQARETDEVIGKVRKWVFLYLRLVKYTIDYEWNACDPVTRKAWILQQTVIFCLCSFVILSSAHWMPTDILVRKEEFSLENCDILMSQLGVSKMAQSTGTLAMRSFYNRNDDTR